MTNIEKPQREPVSKKTRFEVFKRDKFTCQYCGAKAPEVVLHADHIRPVADGGKSDILNLVTACAACNGGKGARLLDDRSAVERQRTQIEDLEARREQLEMMLAWRDAAQAETVDTVEAISERLGERGGFVPNESGKSHIRKWLKRFTFAEVLAALDEAFDHYMKFAGDEPDKEAWEVAFAKIPAMANLHRQASEKPYMPKLAYIQGILRKRFNDRFGKYIEALESYHVEDGLSLVDMEAAAKRAADWNDFCGEMQIAIDELGGERYGQD